MEILSVIVPCYNEESALPFFLTEIIKQADNMSTIYDLEFEIIFINDGSKDNTLNILREAVIQDDRIRYISFSRNFGKESAIYAGFQYCKGDYIVVMDADLQHPPEMLDEMYQGVKEEDYDCVVARRVDRKGEPKIRSFLAKRFYKIINKISKAEFVDGASDFRFMTRQVVDAILSMHEYNRFSKGIFGWVGFRTKWIPYQNVERVAGETKWSFWKLFLYSLEGIIGYSTAPLAIASLLGLIFFAVAIIWMCVIIVDTICNGSKTAGFPTLACLLLMVGGSIQFSLGIIGQYLAKTYLETKQRPIYLVAETELAVRDQNRT